MQGQNFLKNELDLEQLDVELTKGEWLNGGSMIQRDNHDMCMCDMSCHRPCQTSFRCAVSYRVAET